MLRWFAVLVVAMAVSGCAKKVVVKTETELYRVEGATHEEVRVSLYRKRPLTRHDAMAVWKFRVKFGHAKDSTGCRASDTKVTAFLTLVRPRWNSPKGASAQLRADWNRYTDELVKRHKKRRAIIGRFARKLYAQTRRLLQPDCDALDRKAGNLEQLLYTQHNAEQEALLRMENNPLFPPSRRAR